MVYIYYIYPRGETGKRFCPGASGKNIFEYDFYGYEYDRYVINQNKLWLKLNLLSCSPFFYVCFAVEGGGGMRRSNVNKICCSKDHIHIVFILYIIRHQREKKRSCCRTFDSKNVHALSLWIQYNKTIVYTALIGFFSEVRVHEKIY